MNNNLISQLESRYVSRAGAKLHHALEQFGISLKDKVCADLGCSTGGFTDCMLQHGATRVYAVDTGYGVLDWNLRNDPRVVVMERTNALHVELPELVDFISIDVGWTPQKLIVPVAIKLLKDAGDIVTLLKPHYEVDSSNLREGKITTETAEATKENIKMQLMELGCKIMGETTSPITGKKGQNIEYLLWIQKR